MRKARQMPLTVQINCSYNVAAIVSDNATDLSINSPIFGYMGRHLCQTINNPPNINGVLHIQMQCSIYKCSAPYVYGVLHIQMQGSIYKCGVLFINCSAPLVYV